MSFFEDLFKPIDKLLDFGRDLDPLGDKTKLSSSQKELERQAVRVNEIQLENLAKQGEFQGRLFDEDAASNRVNEELFGGPNRLSRDEFVANQRADLAEFQKPVPEVSGPPTGEELERRILEFFPGFR